mmetsp:Transcript_158454/g.508293  ORF Transcript_158454/g.508293 Transcript_158454/m.508293 type:complete len:240 (-) Transcript_158454:1541-2260(-)
MRDLAVPPDRDISRRQVEAHDFIAARRQHKGLLEATQHALGLSCGGRELQVELRDLRARNQTQVLNAEFHGDLSAVALVELRLLHPLVAELCVAKPVPKRVSDRLTDERVPTDEDALGCGTLQALTDGLPIRILFRESHRQPSRRIDLAEEHIGKRIAGLLPSQEEGDDGGGVFREVGKNGTAAHREHHEWQLGLRGVARRQPDQKVVLIKAQGGPVGGFAGPDAAASDGDVDVRAAGS